MYLSIMQNVRYAINKCISSGFLTSNLVYLMSNDTPDKVISMKNEKQFKIPYGESSFEFIRTENFLYVDKTKFIPWLEGTTKLIHLRPRRFGKSLFVSMLEAYYDVANADKFDELFDGLYIHENQTKNRSNYYVLHFDFSGIATTDLKVILDGFKDRVEKDIKAFVKYYNLDIECTSKGTPAMILGSLLTAFRGLALKHKIYILIDEYDHFTNAVLDNGLTDFLPLVKRGGIVRSFYETIKIYCKHGVVERFFITGVMSVSLDSMTSGFNIGTNITTNEEFADLMGFTSTEVRDILLLPLENTKKEKIELTLTEQEEVYEIWKQNYNGYLFSEDSETKMFNSTLIIYYLQQYTMKKKHLRDLGDPNLNQNGTTIKILAELKNLEVNYEVVSEVIQEGVVSGRLSKFINIDEKYDRNDFITLLFNIGFLTINEPDMLTKFEVPNKIIKSIYFEYLRSAAETRYNYKIDTSAQEKALSEMGKQGKITAITAHVEDFLQHLAGRTAINFNEKYIKMSYMHFLFPTNQFIVFDEFPAKLGYTDLTILKSPMSYAQYEFLIELKHVKKGVKDETTESRVESKFADGVNQIAEYMQDKRMQGRPNLKKFDVVFAGFEVARMEEIT